MRLPTPPPATPRSAWRDPWWLAGLAVSLVALVVPLWTSAFLPFMDLPQHLATTRVLHSLGDPVWGLAGFYEIDVGSTQYLAYYGLVEALALLVPLEAAHRLALSLYAVTLPLALASYLTAFGRDRAVALLGAPLVYNTFLFMGFANYLLALPLVLWGLAVLRRLVDQDRGRQDRGRQDRGRQDRGRQEDGRQEGGRDPWRRFAVLVGITVALFYMHAQAFLVYLLGACVIGLMVPRGIHPRHWWRAALHLVPSLALMGIWVWRSAILAGEEAWRQGHGGRNVSPVEARWEPLIERLVALPRQLTDAYRDDADEIVLVCLLGLALLLALARRFEPDPAEVADRGPTRAWLRARCPEVVALTVFAAYLLAPISYKWIWPISHRLIPVVALLSLPMLAWRALRWRPLVLIVPATALAVYASTVHVERAAAFSEEAGAVREVLTDAEPGRRLHALIYDRGSRHVHHAPFLHFGQYYVVDRGGVATFSFVDFPQSPIRYDAERGPPRLPNRFEWTPERFRFDRHGRYYDYFLVRDGGPGKPRRPFAGHEDAVELVRRDGRWALYRRKAAFESGSATL